jgi:uncharacterized Zn finger protein
MFWKPYVSASERRAQSRKLMDKMKKKGIVFQPITIEGRLIAKTFWGKAWCNSMDSHADFSNRLPRGKTYVRNGSLIDLNIESGHVKAKVQGSSLYEVTISVEKLKEDKWNSLKKSCSGEIFSALELLKGKISNATMLVMTHPESGLFPKSREISFRCSCPDYASMCKHIAATLYGVGARLDNQPELLFTLRGVDHKELISKIDTSMAQGKAKVVNVDNLGSLFGIDLDETEIDRMDKKELPPKVAIIKKGGTKAKKSSVKQRKVDSHKV